MIRANFAALFALSAIATTGAAKAQIVPATVPAQTTAPAARNRAANPANEGRLQLDHFLDGIAAQDEANRAGAVAAIRTRQQAEARQAKVRGEILALIGAFPERTPLHAKVLGETNVAGENGAEGFRIQKLLFESQPNFFVTALLYVPDGDAPGGKRGVPDFTAGRFAVGNIEQRGDKEIGLAFKQQFLNAEARGAVFACHFRLADDFGVEGRALGKRADERKNQSAHFGLAGFGLLPRADGGHCGCAAGGILRRDAVEKLIELEAAPIGRVGSPVARCGRCVLGWSGGRCSLRRGQADR